MSLAIPTGFAFTAKGTVDGPLDKVYDEFTFTPFLYTIGRLPETCVTVILYHVFAAITPTTGENKLLPDEPVQEYEPLTIRNGL
jgi:hypothetical protein